MNPNINKKENIENIEDTKEIVNKEKTQENEKTYKEIEYEDPIFRKNPNVQSQTSSTSQSQPVNTSATQNTLTDDLNKNIGSGYLFNDDQVNAAPDLINSSNPNLSNVWASILMRKILMSKDKK